MGHSPKLKTPKTRTSP